MRIHLIHQNVRCWSNYTNAQILSNYYLSKDPDVITINGHSISQQHKNIKLLNYSGFTKNKQAHSGVAILIKSNIQHIFHTNTFNKNIMAATIYTMKGKVTIITFYRPPRDNFLPLMDLQSLLNLNNPTIILADTNIFNKHFGHPRTDKLGRTLHKFMVEKDLHFLGPHFKTYFQGTQKGKPDLIFCNTQFLQLATHIKEGDRLVASDHIPIHVTFSSNPIAIPSDPKFNFNRADWPSFRKHMEELELPNLIKKDTHEIDKHWEILMDHIMEGANKYIPKTNFKIIPAFTPSTKTRNLQNIYIQRHNLYKHNLTEYTKNILNNIQGHIKTSMEADLQQYWTNKLKELEEYKLQKDPKKLFRTAKNLMGTPNFNKGTYLLHNNKQIHDIQEQADIFAGTWEEIMTQNKVSPDPIIQQHFTDINIWKFSHLFDIIPHYTIDFNRLDKTNPIIAPIRLIDTINFMNKIKSQTAGPSGLNTIIIKHTPKKTAIHVTRLLNASLCTGHFPKPFKKANIFLILKPLKPPTDPKSYRPISLLEPFSKLFEKILTYRLRNHLEGRQMNPNQYGFRPDRSTEQIIHLSLQYLDLYHSKRKKTASISLDVAKAFDTVWHDGLIFKIFNHYNLPGLIKKILSNFLTDRLYTIIHNSTHSRQFTSKAGVPQGSVLAPLLYILYTNDTPQTLHQNSVCLQYADDITILTHSHQYSHLNNIIKKEINNIHQYQAKWLINTNMEKSSIVLYKQHPSRVKNYDPIRINNKVIPFKFQADILGVKFDHNLSLRSHINKRYNMAASTLNKLKRFKGLHPNIQFLFFQMLSLSQLLFSPSALIFPPKFGLKKAQTLQSKALRQIHNIHWADYKTNLDIHLEHNIQPTTEKIHNRFCRTHYKLLNLDNHIQDKLLRNTNRDTRHTILLANPPDCILNQ